MKPRGDNLRRWAAMGLLALLPALPALPGRASNGGEPVRVGIVAHPDVPVSDLSLAELRKILMGDRQYWPGGKKVVVLVLQPGSPERQVVLQRIYGMSESQYRRYWIAKLFRAEATAEPRSVPSSRDAVDLVGAIEGAIAVVAARDVPEGLKVLRIEGAAPGDPNYPLQ